jgi:DNA-binding LytR/AlgR family response regulator
LGLVKDVKDKDASAVVDSDHIFVRSDKRFVKLFFSEILLIEGLKDYVVIHNSNKQKVITAMNVKTIFDQLPHEIFARVSKSHIVNTQHIQSIDTNTIFIRNEEVPIGTSYRDDLYNRFVYKNIAKR